jgi:hypothetical protein
VTQAVESPLLLPDWAQVADEITCPLCDYNLRGLVEPRCPECGYQFNWHELLNVHRKPHPYLFEHQRDRNFWSFWKTAIGGLRPTKFWKTLTPLQISHPRRLIFYWLAVTLVGLLGPAVLCLQPSVDQAFGSPSRRVGYRSSPPVLILFGASFGSYWRCEFNTDRLLLEVEGVKLRSDVTQAALVAAAAVVLWPLGTLLTFMIFQASMRRARIKHIHVLRCVLYSSDGAVWFGLAMVLTICVYTVLAGFHMGKYYLSPIFVMMSLLVAWIIFFARRLAVANRLYMQMDHPAAVVVATQIILLLSALCIFLR